MKRWIAPLLFGLALALAGWQVAMTLIPRALMAAAVTRLEERGGGANLFAHAPPATPDARTIVRPSPDLAYSSCALDLADRPVLIEVPPLPAPYWSLSVFDSRTDAMFVRGGADAPEGLRIAVVRAGQQAPAGVEAVALDGRRGIALIRALAPDPAGFAAIDAARRAAVCRPL
jgi:uncharacterized membrane protein